MNPPLNVYHFPQPSSSPPKNPIKPYQSRQTHVTYLEGPGIIYGWIQKVIPSLKLTWPMKIPTFPGKYHWNGGFSMAMLVYRRVTFSNLPYPKRSVLGMISLHNYLFEVMSYEWLKCIFLRKKNKHIKKWLNSNHTSNWSISISRHRYTWNKIWWW